jgi:hypothetical protein
MVKERKAKYFLIDAPLLCVVREGNEPKTT